MLIVKTYLDKSSIDGIGLFAAEDILEGQKISEYSDLFNSDIPCEHLLDSELVFANKYAVKKFGHFCFFFDDERFMNHSDDPNTVQESVYTCIAKRNIKKGEEITCNYKELE